ncbi:uncharacterized protein LOC112452708 isoform X3 [Temnothorax curvispinosus]|uniref:Uncharacterized protein LOC112452708 isoform X3 n=1 Tax=Temnothorax curvispinosus TaxID=300111 RepID=A0A6J1PHT3_9HYME|nr:uncharacterized protein LOC112452708 isoform X3 [Temnothorax curvispinosus]
MLTLPTSRKFSLHFRIPLRGRKAVEYFMHFQRSHKMSKRLIETKQSIKNLVVERGGSRAASSTIRISEDGSSGQHADYYTEIEDCESKKSL